jgi:TerB N-terminal domain/TerB-C domain/Tellurite resistance protein TerB
MKFKSFWDGLADLGIALPHPSRIKPESPEPEPQKPQPGRRASLFSFVDEDEDAPIDMAELFDMMVESGILHVPSLGRTKQQCWIPVDQTVAIADYEIPGMVYVSDSLSSIKNYNLIEPSLISPSLKVNSHKPDYEGKHLDYSPTYGRIPPASRAAYLEWLANERRDPDVHVGYLWLFFYGLERRVFYDLLGAGRQPDTSLQEIEVILEEVQRLRSIYSAEQYATFQHKAKVFTDLCSVLYSETSLYDSIDPFETNILLLQIGLGQLVVAKQPIPANWALAWYSRLTKNRLRAAATRCMDEFQTLFQLRYTQAYGDGMTLKPGKSMLRVDYHPASPSFNRSVRVDVGDLPDVSKFAGKISKLGSLVADCTAPLEALGRLLGRNANARNTPAAIALLPPELLTTHGGELVNHLQTWLSPQISQNPVAISGEELFQHWSGANPEKLSKAESEGLSQLLEQLGYGIEPDPRLGGAFPKLTGRVALFRLDSDNLRYLSPEYLTATLVAHLAIAIANGDELPSPIEQDYLTTHLLELIQLTNSERSRLQAHIHLLLQDKPALRNLKARVEAVAPEQRGTIARFLVSVAVADGQASPKEIDRLTKAYALLELDSQSLYSDIHDASTGSRPANEPITVRIASPTSGHTIPPQAQKKLTLDMSMVESKISESHEVSNLLADIFVEEAVPPIILETGIAGLDMPHTQLLRALTQKSEWQRNELEAIARSLNLMLDGALEAINEAAFDQCDEALIEGEDPFEINPDVLQELLA